MSDNSKLIYRLRRAQIATINRTKLDQLLEDAIDALLANHPGHPFPDWVRDILRSNDADWGARLKREQEKVETLRATERDNSRAISDLKADNEILRGNYKRSKEDRERAANFLRAELHKANCTINRQSEEMDSLKASVRKLAIDAGKLLHDSPSFDLQAENKALIEENESLIRDMTDTERENLKLREAMHDIATTANRAQQDPS